MSEKNEETMTQLKESGESETEWQIYQWSLYWDALVPSNFTPLKTEEDAINLLESATYTMPEEKFKIFKITKTPMEEVKG